MRRVLGENSMTIMQLQARLRTSARCHPVFGGTSSKIWIFAVGLFLLSLVDGTGSQNVITDKSAQIDALISHYQHCGYLNGAVLVAQHGHICFAKGVGAANMETQLPNTPETRFGIASITKQF